MRGSVRWCTDGVIKFLRSKGWNICELEKVPDVNEIDRAAAAAASKQQQQGPSQHVVFESSSSEENTQDVDTPPPAPAASGPSHHIVFESSSEDETGQRPRRGVDTGPAAAGMYERLV